MILSQEVYHLYCIKMTGDTYRLGRGWGRSVFHNLKGTLSEGGGGLSTLKLHVLYAHLLLLNHQLLNIIINLSYWCPIILSIFHVIHVLQIITRWDFPCVFVMVMVWCWSMGRFTLFEQLCKIDTPTVQTSHLPIYIIILKRWIELPNRESYSQGLPAHVDLTWGMIDIYFALFIISYYTSSIDVGKWSRSISISTYTHSIIWPLCLHLTFQWRPLQKSQIYIVIYCNH